MSQIVSGNDDTQKNVLTHSPAMLKIQILMESICPRLIVNERRADRNGRSIRRKDKIDFVVNLFSTNCGDVQLKIIYQFETQMRLVKMTEREDCKHHDFFTLNLTENDNCKR